MSLNLRDDGSGAASFRPGNGLTGMRERVEALGGTLQVHCEADAGFGIEVQLPPLAGVSQEALK